MFTLLQCQLLLAAFSAWLENPENWTDECRVIIDKLEMEIAERTEILANGS